MADYAIHDTTLTGISNVIRKKDGTSALIDPADYPKRINLMGMLEEKTVSGAIVTFSDGADEVPLKKCEITLPASLDGYSSVDVVSTGKNLFDKNAVEQHTWIIVDSTETETRSNINYLTSDYIPVKANTRYYVSAKASNRAAYYDRNKNGISYFSFSGGASFNSLYDGYIRLTIKDDTDLDAFIVNEGNEAIIYEPFGATHTASLGRTIYGGKPDVVNGQGESSYKIVTVGNSGWNYYASGGYIYKDFPDKITPSIGDIDHVLITDNLPYGGVNYASQFQDLHVYQAQNKAIYIKDTSCTSADDFYTKYSDMQIGYELATPEPFTFDPVPIDSKLGNNTLWAEQGSSVEVTYRGQGTAYIYPNAEEASF